MVRAAAEPGLPRCLGGPIRVELRRQGAHPSVTAAPRKTGNPTLAYVAPFATFVGIMAMERLVQLPPQILYPFRFLVVLAVTLRFSRSVIPLRPSRPLASIGIGIAVFLIWIGPDLLFGYRHHWLFENSLTGSASSSLPAGLKAFVPFVALRAFSSTFLVPVLEELFWRGWLMRWLIDKDFLNVPLGTYVRSAFWIAALLFASEHGSYWEVGLLAGAAYGWWVVRTRNLADCILAHAVTNGILSIYVVAADQWQYWL